MVNRMILQGRLVRDPEMRKTQSGISVSSFTVAWSEKYKETETQLFLDCTAWRGTADMVCKYFVKGKEIVVEGKLQTRKWQDKNGNNRYSTEMQVDKVHFCGPKDDDGGAGDGYRGNDSPHAAGAPVDVSASDFTDIDDDGELPF